MPYVPPGHGLYAIPYWDREHPDLHPRWISLDAKRLNMHQQSFGEFPGYKIYGSDCTSLEELRARCEALGLPDSYVNTNTYRIQIGDVCLACIPRAEHERRQVEKLNSVRQRSDDEINAFLGSSTSRHVRPFAMTEEEFNDKKEFHTRETNNRVGYTGPSR